MDPCVHRSTRVQETHRLALGAQIPTLLFQRKEAGVDRFSDKVYGNDLRRVKNFSTSQSRHKNKWCPQESPTSMKATIPWDKPRGIRCMPSGFMPVVIDLRPSTKATIPWGKLSIPAKH